MRLVDRILGRAERAPLSDTTAQVMMQAFAAPDQTRVTPGFVNNVIAYQGSAVVSGVLNARIDLFTEAEFKFQRLADGSLWGSPALELLERPWPNGTTGDLLAHMEQDGSLSGSAFIRKVSPTRLERLRPDWVIVCSGVREDPYSGDEVRELIGYYYDPPATEGRTPMLFPADEVAHWTPRPDPLNQFCGISWLSSVLREVDADIQMTDYKRAYLTNAATPNLIVKYDQKIGQEQVDRVAAQVRARHGGVDNAFKTMVLDLGADVQVLGNNFEQMSFTSVQSAGENRIAVAGRVPSVVAGLKEGLDAANYAVFDAALRSFANGTMRPLWRSVCAALAKLVEVPPDSRLWFNEAGIAALRQGEKEQADTMAVLAQALRTLMDGGIEPDTAISALSAGDLTLAKWGGNLSVQLQPPGSTPSPKEGAA